MTTILQLSTSIHSAEAASSQLARQLVERLRQTDPNARVIQRDLASQPTAHLDAEKFQAFQTKPEDRSPRQQALAGESDSLITELRDADVLVIGLPMYNFGIPSTLKAWFDHIARAGHTFRYTENGPVGLMTGKKAYVVATRGGKYAGTDADTQSQYVRNFLRFLGIEDVEFVYAEGLAMGADARKNSIAAAKGKIGRLATQVQLAA